MKRFLFLLTLLLIPLSSLAQAQSQAPQIAEEKKGIYAVVKDGQGDTLEGFLRFNTDVLTVRSKENQEKSISLKYIKSITLEKTKDEISGSDLKKEATYNVRLMNSQEIYTLQKKYTFSLSTNLGMVSKSIDPEKVSNFFSKEGSQTVKPDDGRPFIQDKSVVFSLEFKF